MKKIKELMTELDRWKIQVSVENMRIVLSGGDKYAREYYRTMIRKHRSLEVYLILELSQTDPDLRYEIEERAAIRWADGGPGDLYSAITCSFTD